MGKPSAIASALLFALALHIGANQELKLRENQNYLLLNGTKIQSLQKKMDEASAKGFRLRLTSVLKGEIQIFLDRTAKSNGNASYTLFSSPDPEAIVRTLNDLGSKGYHLLPQSVMHSPVGYSFATHTIFTLESDPAVNGTYEYLLIPAAGEENRKRTTEALTQGFVGVSLAYADKAPEGSEVRIILEKARGKTAATGPDPRVRANQRLVVISAGKPDQIENKVNEAAKDGLRIIAAAHMKKEIHILLGQERQPEDGMRVEYHILATFERKTLGKELNDAAAKGFRLLPRASFYSPSFFTFKNEFVAILESMPQTAMRYEYTTFPTGLNSNYPEETEKQIANGFTPVAMINGLGFTWIGEKAVRNQP